MLLGYGDDGEPRNSKSIGPLCERSWSEVVRQERRIQHHVAGNISDDGLVEHSVSRPQNGAAIAEDVPGQSDARGKVVVVGIIDAIHLRLRNDTRSSQRTEIALDAGNRI